MEASKVVCAGYFGAKSGAVVAGTGTTAVKVGATLAATGSGTAAQVGALIAATGLGPIGIGVVAAVGITGLILGLDKVIK